MSAPLTTLFLQYFSPRFLLCFFTDVLSSLNPLVQYYADLSLIHAFWIILPIGLFGFL